MMPGLPVILIECYSCSELRSPEILPILEILRQDTLDYLLLIDQLYSHTNIGTKRVVEDYISEVQECLQFLLRVESPLVSDAKKLDLLTCLRQVPASSSSLNSRHMDGQLCFFQAEGHSE